MPPRKPASPPARDFLADAAAARRREEIPDAGLPYAIFARELSPGEFEAERARFLRPGKAPDDEDAYDDLGFGLACIALGLVDGEGRQLVPVELAGDLQERLGSGLLRRIREAVWRINGIGEDAAGN